MAAKLGFCVSSDATGNDLEDEAPAASPTLPAVDETRAAGGGERQAAKSLVGPVMRRDGGFGKGRLTADARRSPSVPVLLTSSRPLGELAALAGIKVDDAHHGRLVGVPPPDAGHGAFGDLHGAAADSADANSRDPCGISDASAPPRRRRTRVRAVGQGTRSTRRPRSRRGAGDRPPALSDRADASLTRISHER